MKLVKTDPRVNPEADDVLKLFWINCRSDWPQQTQSGYKVLQMYIPLQKECISLLEKGNFA